MTRSEMVIGRDMGPAARLFRLLFAITAVASLAYRVDDHLDASGIGAMLLYLVAISAGYVGLFWVLSLRLLGRTSPWVGSALLQIPTLLYPANVGSTAFHDALAAYSVLGVLLCGLMGYGGIEVGALPSLILRKRYQLYSPFNTADLAERALARSAGAMRVLWALAAAAVVFSFLEFWVVPLALTVPPVEDAVSAIEVPEALAAVLLIAAGFFALRRMLVPSLVMVALVPLHAGHQVPDLLFGVIMLVGLVVGVVELVRSATRRAPAQPVPDAPPAR